MDLIYPSSSSAAVILRRTPSPVRLIVVALATALSVVSIVLSVTSRERARSKVNIDRQPPAAAKLRPAGLDDTCLPCSSVVDDDSSLEDQLWFDVFFRGHGFGSSHGATSDGGTDDGDLCCARGPRQLKLILRMFKNIRSRKEAAREPERRSCLVVFPSTEASPNGTRCLLDNTGDVEIAHLSQAEPSMSDGMLGWKNTGVSEGGVEKIDGRLTAESGGIYFVYSQVYFVDYGEERSTDAADDAVTIRINRRVSGEGPEVPVCERSERRCSRAMLASSSPCEYSAYTGSLVALEAREAVSVSVSHPSMVNDDEKLTYFGLYKIT